MSEAETNAEVRASLEAEFDKIADDKESSDRDDKGRFKAKEPEEPVADSAPETAVEEPSGEVSPDQGSETVTEPAEQPLSAPDRWSAEWKTKFTALPRDAQQVLLDRESEFDKGFTQKSQEAADLKRRYEPLDQILSPRHQAWAMQGLDEQRALTQLFALSDFAASKPEDFINWFASQRGITLASLVQQPGTEQPPAQPDFSPVLNRVNAIEQNFNAMQQAETDRQINAFKSAPGHEHFETVRAEMGRLMTSGLATDMQDAYEKACRVNPTTWATIQASQQKAIDDKLKADKAAVIEKQKQDAAKARKAAGTTITAKGTLSGAAPAPANIRESLNQAYDQIHSAA